QKNADEAWPDWIARRRMRKKDGDDTVFAVATEPACGRWRRACARAAIRGPTWTPTRCACRRSEALIRMLVRHSVRGLDGDAAPVHLERDAHAPLVAADRREVDQERVALAGAKAHDAV